MVYIKSERGPGRRQHKWMMKWLHQVQARISMSVSFKTSWAHVLLVFYAPGSSGLGSHCFRSVCLYVCMQFLTLPVSFVRQDTVFIFGLYILWVSSPLEGHEYWTPYDLYFACWWPQWGMVLHKHSAIYPWDTRSKSQDGQHWCHKKFTAGAQISVCPACI